MLGHAWAGTWNSPSIMKQGPELLLPDPRASWADLVPRGAQSCITEVQEKLQKSFVRKPWKIWGGPTCFFYMLIDIITASRRVGDVIMCNKVDLKIKKASQHFIWNVQISCCCWKMITFGSTPPLRGVRENSKTLPSVTIRRRAVPNSQWQLPVKCKHMTERKEKAGNKDTAALSSTEKWLVNGNKGKLSKLPWRLLHLPKLFNRC